MGGELLLMSCCVPHLLPSSTILLHSALISTRVQQQQQPQIDLAGTPSSTVQPCDTKDVHI